MITFDSLTLKSFITENRDFLTGARIQKIQQPTRRDFILTVHGFSKNGIPETRKLYINIDPQYYHICFMNKQNEEKRHIEIPQHPPMFCMLLRKYLKNCKINVIHQPAYERIIEFYTETFNKSREKMHLCFAVEFMGKHSNAVLYNSDTNVIIGCAHNVGADKSRKREMSGTLPYFYPPKQNKIDILNYTGNIDYEKINTDFYWFSKSFESQVKNVPPERLKDYVRLKNISPAISGNYAEYTLFSELFEENIPQNSVNEMLDNYYAFHMQKNKIKNLKTYLTSIINPKLKKSKNSLSKILTQSDKEKNADKYRLYGDLIIANLYNSKDYSKTIKLYDYENEQNITIELDAALPLKENALKFYKLYTKSKTSLKKLKEVSEKLKADISYYEDVLYLIEMSETIENLEEIQSEIAPEKEKQTKSQPSNQPLELIIEKEKVWIGRNNRQNDYIVSKLARDEDYWFHIKDCAGAHVLLRKQNPAEELIFECAKLAKEYSSAKLSPKAGVIYTKRKYLKKHPKAKLGYVTYSNEKELIV